MKITFNHDAESLNIAMGVTKQRSLKLDSLMIFECIQVYVRRGVLFAGVPFEEVPAEFGTISGVIEKLINRITDDAEIAIVLMKITSIHRLIRKTRMDILKLRMFLEKEEEGAFELDLIDESQLRGSLLRLDSFIKLCKAAEACSDDPDIFYELIRADNQGSLSELFKRIGQISREATEGNEDDEDEDES